MSTLDGFLSWMTGAEGGAFILVSWALSWALEYSEGWKALDAKVKTGVILLVSLILGLVAVFLKTQPALLAAVDPYFHTLSSIVTVWLATQTAHRLNSLRPKSAGQ
jgi:hypothetical protein